MKFNLPININNREKKFLLIGGMAILLIVFYQAYSWYAVTKTGIKEFADAKLFRIEKELARLSDKPALEKSAKAVSNELMRQERGLLQGDKPPVAAAALQKILKDAASSLKIEVKLERALNPVDAELYMGIPVEIGFTSTTTELKDLLLKLRNRNMLLTVSEIKVRVTNIRDPKEIYTTLIVMGFIKKPAEDQPKKEKKKNVS